MAIQSSNGPLGQISGRVGNKIYYVSNGKQYVKSAPKRYSKPPRAGQINQREKMKLAVHLISGIREILKECISAHTWKEYTMGYIIKRNLKDGITNQFPDFEIDFRNVVLTRGMLASSCPRGVKLEENNMLYISWGKIPHLVADEYDEVLVFLCEKSHKRIWAWPATGAIRSNYELRLDLSHALAGQQLHVWLAFRSRRGEYSKSTYAGFVDVLVSR